MSNELVWHDGKKYTLNEVFQRVRSFCEWRLLAPLSRGEAPGWLPLRGDDLRQFRCVADTLDSADPTLGALEPRWRIRRLIGLLTAFDRRHFGSHAFSAGACYAMRFGLQCASELDGFGPDRDGEGLLDRYALLVGAARRGPVPTPGDTGPQRGPRPLKILFVDDEAEMCDLFQLHLERRGHEFQRALDGSAGVLAARRWKPDVILLNYLMPVMDGLTACGELGEDPRTWSIPIIMHSGCSHIDLIAHALRVGAWEWLLKPFNGRRLERSIRHALICRGPGGPRA